MLYVQENESKCLEPRVFRAKQKKLEFIFLGAHQGILCSVPPPRYFFPPRVLTRMCREYGNLHWLESNTLAQFAASPPFQAQSRLLPAFAAEWGGGAAGESQSMPYRH